MRSARERQVAERLAGTETETETVVAVAAHGGGGCTTEGGEGRGAKLKG